MSPRRDKQGVDTDELEDEALLARTAQGDESALRVLLARHSPWLRLRLRRRCGDDELVDSALQDTFTQVWRHAGRYRGDGEVGAWLWGIAIRQLLSRMRGRRAPVPLSDQVVLHHSPAARSAEDEVLVALEHGDVGQAMAQLSPELRQALQATVLDGLTAREASRLLGLPLGTVKSRVRLARAHLRRTLLEATS